MGMGGECIGCSQSFGGVFLAHEHVGAAIGWNGDALLLLEKSTLESSDEARR